MSINEIMKWIKFNVQHMPRAHGLFPFGCRIWQNMLRKPRKGDMSHLLQPRKAWAEQLDRGSTMSLSASVLLTPREHHLVGIMGEDCFWQIYSGHTQTSSCSLFMTRIPHIQEALECMRFLRNSAVLPP